MKTIIWFPSIIRNAIIAWLMPRGVFLKIYSPSSETERTYEEHARNQLNLLEYRAKKILYK